jgi:hypothetical protein
MGGKVAYVWTLVEQYPFEIENLYNGGHRYSSAFFNIVLTSYLLALSLIR